MTICTRQTTGTGVTCKGSPLTNTELDNNFINIVADIADKQDSSSALTTSTSFSGDITGAYNSTALAADTVGTSELNTLNTASDGNVLQYVSSPTAGICWGESSGGALGEDSVGITELDIALTGSNGKFVAYNGFSGGDFCWATPPNQYIGSASVSNNCIVLTYQQYGPPALNIDMDCANFDLPRCSVANTFTQYNTFNNFLCVSGQFKSSNNTCICGSGRIEILGSGGFYNTYYGCRAGQCAVTGICYATQIGVDAGRCNCSGDFNTSIGFAAAACGRSGGNNTAVGAYAGYYNCIQYRRTTIGYAAGFCNASYDITHVGSSAGCCSLGPQGTAVGSSAASNSRCFTGGVAIGYAAGRGASFNIKDYQNVLVGPYTAYDTYNSSFNVMIGVCTGYHASYATNNVAIGNGNFKVSGDLYGTCCSQHNISIGSNSMTCAGYARCNIVIGSCAGYRIGNGGGLGGCNNVLIGIGAGTNECIGGFLGLANITGTCSNQIILGNCCNTCARIKVNWTVVSDCRDKSCFSCVPHGLDFVRALEPKEYRFKTSGRLSDDVEDKKRYGFLAQEVLALEGDSPVVVSNEDSNSLTMTESHLIPILVNAIKELASRVEALENA